MVRLSGLLLFPCALLLGGGNILVLSSDVNWGKKVNCFVVDGTVVCPGCNYRAGLSCPRKLKNSQNCLTTSTLPPTSKPPTTQAKTTYEELNITDTTWTLLDDLDSPSPPEDKEIQKESTKSPIDMTIYLYRLIGSRLPKRLYRREIHQEEEKEVEEEAEICNWNGDCPCPLICCKTGPGCPKRCVMGIRLPPPWG